MRNYLKLFLYCFILYVFFGHFTPFIVTFFPHWQAYVEKAEEYGIEPGALYYTDVSVSSDSERVTRDAAIKAYGSEWRWKSVRTMKTDSNTTTNAKGTNLN